MRQLSCLPPVWPDLAKNLPLWLKFHVLGQCFECLLSIWQNFDPPLAKMFCYWVEFHCCKWPKTKKLTLPCSQTIYHLYYTTSACCKPLISLRIGLKRPIRAILTSADFIYSTFWCKSGIRSLRIVPDQASSPHQRRGSCRPDHGATGRLQDRGREAGQSCAAVVRAPALRTGREHSRSRG